MTVQFANRDEELALNPLATLRSSLSGIGCSVLVVPAVSGCASP
jgi:hypothetical protein